MRHIAIGSLSTTTATAVFVAERTSLLIVYHQRAYGLKDVSIVSGQSLRFFKTDGSLQEVKANTAQQN